jgi:hypothetical protein
MYMIMLNRDTGRIWNTRDNTIHEISIKAGQTQAFLKQVAGTVRKDTGNTAYTSSPSFTPAQSDAVTRYKKKSAAYTNKYFD